MLRSASRFIRQTRTGTVAAQRRNTRATMSFPRRSQRYSHNKVILTTRSFGIIPSYRHSRKSDRVWRNSLKECERGIEGGMGRARQSRVVKSLCRDLRLDRIPAFAGVMF